MIDRHHLVPKSRMKRGEPRIPNNRIRIKRERHIAWHILFGDKTLAEIINLLQRVYRFKKTNQRR